MVDVFIYANLRRFTAILPATTYYTNCILHQLHTTPTTYYTNYILHQLHTTPNEKYRASFKVFAAEQQLIPFLCDMASCHRDKISNKKFRSHIYTLQDEGTTGCLEKSWSDCIVKQHHAAEEWNLQGQMTSLQNWATERYSVFIHSLENVKTNLYTLIP